MAEFILVFIMWEIIGNYIYLLIGTMINKNEFILCSVIIVHWYIFSPKFTTKPSRCEKIYRAAKHNLLFHLISKFLFHSIFFEKNHKHTHEKYLQLKLRPGEVLDPKVRPSALSTHARSLSLLVFQVSWFSTIFSQNFFVRESLEKLSSEDFHEAQLFFHHNKNTFFTLIWFLITHPDALKGIQIIFHPIYLSKLSFAVEF